VQAISRQSAVRKIVVVASCILCLVGCSTTRVDWASRVGIYTYDRVVIELGPPDKQATLTDGTVVADWILRRGGIRRVDVGFYYGYGPYGCGPGYPTYVDHYIPDYLLRLSFDSAGQLKAWKKLTR
jgi:hypothetical protein